MVVPAATRTPIAAILRSGRRARRQPARPRSARGPGRCEPERGTGRDHRLLEPADVVDDADRLGQPDDRVADQLARAVPGDLAAAVDVDDGRAVQRALVRLGPLAGGVDLACSSSSTQARGCPGDLGVHDALQVPGALVVQVLDDRAAGRGTPESRRRVYVDHSRASAPWTAEATVARTSGSLNTKPSAVSRSGTTYMSPSSCSASSPRAVRSITVGARKKHRRPQRPGQGVGELGVRAGSGIVRLYGPRACAVVAAQRTTPR